MSKKQQQPRPQTAYGMDWDPAPQIETWVDSIGGVVSQIPPFYLRENEANYLKNADLDQQGARSKRRGAVSVGTPVNAAPYGGFFWTIGGWDISTNNIGIWGGQMYRSTYPTDCAWTACYSPATAASFPPSFYGFTPGRYLAGGTTAHQAMFVYGVDYFTAATYPKLYAVSDDGTATMCASYNPCAASWFQGRLWFGHDNDSLFWSNIGDGLTIGASNYIQVGWRDGDQISALIPARGDTSRLYIFKRHRIYALNIVWAGGVYIPATENSLDTTQSQLTIVSERCGCVAPKTIVYTGGGVESDVLFLAHDGFRSLARVEMDKAGGAGLPVSEPIKDVIRRISWFAVRKAHATIWDNKVYLSIPVDNATYCNLVIVYDLINKIWIGEYDWQTKDLWVNTLSNQDEHLFFQNYASTSDYLSGNTATAATTGYHVFDALHHTNVGYRDPAYATITYEERSRAFPFDAYGHIKRWNWMEAMLPMQSASATFSVYCKIDNHDWSLVAHHWVGAAVTGASSVAETVERFGLIDQPPGHSIQFKITHSAASAFQIRATRVAAWLYPDLWEE